MGNLFTKTSAKQIDELASTIAHSPKDNLKLKDFNYKIRRNHKCKENINFVDLQPSGSTMQRSQKKSLGMAAASIR